MATKEDPSSSYSRRFEEQIKIKKEIKVQEIKSREKATKGTESDLEKSDATESKLRTELEDARRQIIQRELDVRAEFAQKSRKMEQRIRELEQAEKELRAIRRRNKLLEVERDMVKEDDEDKEVKSRPFKGRESEDLDELRAEIGMLRKSNAELARRQDLLQQENEELNARLLDAVSLIGQAISGSPARSSSRPPSRQSLSRVVWDDELRPPSAQGRQTRNSSDRPGSSERRNGESMKAIRRSPVRESWDGGAGGDIDAEPNLTSLRYSWPNDNGRNPIPSSSSRASSPSNMYSLRDIHRSSAPSPSRTRRSDLSPSRGPASQSISSRSMLSDYKKTLDLYHRDITQRIRHVGRPAVSVPRYTTSVYSPEGDVALAVEELAAMFVEAGIDIPIRHLQGNTYLFGGRKLHLFLSNNKLLVHTGGGSLSIWTYLSNMNR
mmetsp:Transcript_4398/g.6801  ORF Transcript_4398/g.6801 Transcript_4398/m.6801 type:complete len:437 (-) Transcript_4398:168-1478(-)